MRKETSGSFDKVFENKTALSLCYLFGVPVLTAIINTVGSFLGYAFMQRMGSFSTENTVLIRTNNTDNTTGTSSGNLTVTPRFHPICKQAIANVNTPAQFAWITFASTAIGFFVVTLIRLAIARACTNPQSDFKKVLQRFPYSAAASNFAASAAFPFTIAFFAFCVDDMDAWHVAAASFLGTDTLMALFLMVFFFGKKGAQYCAQNDKKYPLEIQQTARRLSNDSFQSLHSLPSPRFMPSPSLDLTSPSPATFEPATTTITVPKPGHQRSDTVEFREPS